MTKSMPGAAGDLAEQQPDIWSAYAALGKACADAGPLTDRERRLVKLALAIGAASGRGMYTYTAVVHGLRASKIAHSHRWRCWRLDRSACPARWQLRPGSRTLLRSDYV